MKHLTANVTGDDRARASRLLIAWVDGDQLALDTVLDECMRLPTGTPGILFALTDFTARLGMEVAPHFRDQLRGLVLKDGQLSQDHDDRGEN